MLVPSRGLRLTTSSRPLAVDRHLMPITVLITGLRQRGHS
jgi:hypothetical protein